MAMTYLYGLWTEHKNAEDKFSEFVYNKLPF
ncbi:unnamed protein product, partial [marine sediment metagenome]